MYTVVSEDSKEFQTLTDAMAYAATLGTFVTIKGEGMEICGVFGAAGVVDGKLPNGGEYTFFKRRDSIRVRMRGLPE